MSAHAAALAALPAARTAVIDGVEVVRFELPWGKPTSGALLAAGDGAIEVRARVGFDESTAVALLQAARAIEPTAGEVLVAPIAVGPFTALAVMAPADIPFHQSEPGLNGKVRWAIPLHAGEAPSGMKIKDFNSLIGPAARLEAFDWDRAPQPYCRGRLCTDWPGGMLRKGSKAKMARPQTLGDALGQAPLDARFEFFAADARRIDAVAQLDTVLFESGGAPIEVAREAAEAALVSLLLGESPAPAEVTPWFGMYISDPPKRRHFGQPVPAMRRLAQAQREVEVLSNHPDGFLGFTRAGLTVQFTHIGEVFTVDVPTPGERGSRQGPISRADAAALLADIAKRGEAALDALALPLVEW